MSSVGGAGGGGGGDGVGSDGGGDNAWRGGDSLRGTDTARPYTEVVGL
jgi:hypothetical protein